MKIRAAIAAVAALASIVAIGSPGTAAQATSQPSQVSILALPHPDDETMIASLFDQADSNFQVFATFTHGEATAYCATSTFNQSLDTDLGELRPSPTPQGRFTPSCEQARLSSQIGFFEDMSETITSMPGDFRAPFTTRQFPAYGYSVSRDDNGTRIVDRSAIVHVDRQGRGVVVQFNLGDGDLTRGEVSWAINTMLANRAAFGIPTDLRLWNVLGAYWAPESARGCDGYTHVDHRAVHEALWNSRFGARYTAGATCGSDSDARRDGEVTNTYWDAAFSDGGAFSRNYGWLNMGSWDVDPDGQDAHFHGQQVFWQR